MPGTQSTLRTGDVHIWIAEVTPALSPGRFEATMSGDEMSRAGKFVFEHLRRRYIAAHGILRDILGRYLAKEPREIAFSSNAFGKPFLPVGESDGLYFNMSHASDLVVVALVRDRLIGVDVEFIRPLQDLDALAEYHFSPQERALLANRALSDREPAFFTCWTRKEAYIKAVGKGLSLPLNSFDVSLPAGVAGRRIEPTADSPGVANWWLSDLTMPPAYKGALVVENGFECLSYWNWTP
jgi:4'-phosphopantetheinyl transferase